VGRIGSLLPEIIGSWNAFLEWKHTFYLVLLDILYWYWGILGSIFPTALAVEYIKYPIKAKQTAINIATLKINIFKLQIIFKLILT
jgi:hypothetical protein